MSDSDKKGQFQPNTIIVIGRQFGSGGRLIGKQVAARLGIPYYDKELLSEAAKSLGFSTEVFASADERKPSVFSSFLQGFYSVPEHYHSTSMNTDRLYTAQSEVIRKICEMGSCVIVGRTADYVMRDHPGLVSVFLHAPAEWRAAKIVARHDTTAPEQAVEMARRRDKDRESYYNYFTGRHWGRASNYHLTIDSSLIPEDTVVDMIVEFAKAKVRV